MPVITTSTGAVHKCLPHLLRKGTPVCLFVFVFVFFRRCFLFFFSFCFSLFSLFLFSFVFFGFLSFVGCVCRACHIQYDGMYVVCVLHIKPFFLPVGIQHNQCPCRFFNPINRRDTSSVVTKLRHRDTTLPRMQ